VKEIFEYLNSIRILCRRTGYTGASQAPLC